jgi:hypothetical protein
MSLGRVVFAVILIAFGALMLAGNLGWISWDFVLSLWQLWPLILVIIGIELLLGRRHAVLAAVLILVVVVAGGAFAWYGWSNEGWGWSGARQTVTTIQGSNAAGITSAAATLKIGASDITIRGGDIPRTLQGTWTSHGTPSFTQSVEGAAYTAQFTQNSGGGVFIFGPRRESLEITLATGTGGLAAGLPWDLRLDTGASSSTIDLTTITLRSLAINSGAASVDVKVGPSVIDNATVVIKGGAGSYSLKLSSTLDLRVRTKTGLSSNNFSTGFTKEGDTYVHDGGGPRLAVTIEAGVSSVDVSLY